MNDLLKKLTLATVLMATTALAQTPYDEGQQALREQRWMEAAQLFEQALQADQARADAAMYWRAHALYKASRGSEAERQLREMERKYPDSRWVKEAQALMIEHQDTIDGSGMDDELRIFALARLMERDPERALPMVMDFLHNSKSSNIRNDALFVLGMSENPAAQQAIADIALESDDPELQANAINILGAASDGAALALLADLYSGTADRRVKEAVIHAHISSDEPALLLDILQSETNPELQREIIYALGAMDATDELRGLYPTLSDRESRVAAIEAFFVAGDGEMLRQILETETDPELRTTAIHGIAMEGGEGAAGLLESIYDNATTNHEKTAVLESLFMLDHAENVALKIVRSETDPELQRNAIHVLGAMEATDELAGLYDSIGSVETRKAILESMAIADDQAGLRKILESEQDPSLRAAAIEALAISGDKSVAGYLVSIYTSASREEKSAIGTTMMIMDDVEGLIGLLKQESDPELKREMLHMLASMDSEAADEYLFDLLEKEG